VLFAWPLGLEQAGLTLATSVGACFNAALLFWLLRRKRFYQPRPGWLRFFAKVCVAVALLAIVIAVTMGPGAAWLAAGVTYKVGRLALVVAAGALVYFGALFALGFRVADFNRGEATLPDALPPADDTGG
jgi:putative peptidoglycan lipid II flippase